jgi:hypothetical protein
MSAEDKKDTERLVLSFVLSIAGMGVTFGAQLVLAFVMVLFGPADLGRLLSGQGRTEALLGAAFALPGAAAGLGAWWPWRAVLGPRGMVLLALAGAACNIAPQLAWMTLAIRVPGELWMGLPPLTTSLLAWWRVQRVRLVPPAQPPA